MKWPRLQPVPTGPPRPLTMAVVGLVVFASAFGVARAAGGEDGAETVGGPQNRALALRTATALPTLNVDEAEAEAQRRLARERARERRLAKREKAEAAKKRAAREERR